MAGGADALPTFDFDAEPPPDDTDSPQLLDGAGVAALETDWDPTDGDYIRTLARKGVGPAVVGGICVLGLLCILFVRCLCGPVGQGNAYGPQLRSKWVTTCLTLAGIVTCIIHLIFPVISGSMIAAAGLQIDSSLSGFTHTVTKQVRDIQTNVTFIRDTIISVKPDDVEIDLSPLFDAERQVSDAVDVVEVWSSDARHILNGIKGSFIAFGISAVVLALFGVAVLWRRTRTLLYIFFALSGVWCFIAWLLGTLGVTVRTFFRDLCDILLLHVNGEQNAWILDTLKCRELRRGIRGLGTAMAAANAKNVSALCIPYRTDGEFWFVNFANAPGCVETSNVTAAYGPIVCPAALPPNMPIEQNIDYQVCVLNNTPIPNATFTDLEEASSAFVTLNRALPVIRDFAQCGFVDRAFRAVLRENCVDIDSAMTLFVVGTLIGAIGFVLTLLYMCPCVSKRARRGKVSEASSEVLEQPVKKDAEHEVESAAPPVSKMHRSGSGHGSLKESLSVAVRAGSARFASASRRFAAPDAEAQLVATGPPDAEADAREAADSERSGAAPGALSGVGLAKLQKAASQHFAERGGAATTTTTRGGGHSGDLTGPHLVASQPENELEVHVHSAADTSGPEGAAPGGVEPTTLPMAAMASPAAASEGKRPSGSSGSSEGLTGRIRRRAAALGRTVDVRERRDPDDPPPPPKPAAASGGGDLPAHDSQVTNRLFDSAHGGEGGSQLVPAPEVVRATPKDTAALAAADSALDAMERSWAGGHAAAHPLAAPIHAPPTAQPQPAARGLQAWFLSRRHAPAPAEEPALVASAPENEVAVARHAAPAPLGESESVGAVSDAHVGALSSVPMAADAYTSMDSCGSMFLPPILSPEASMRACTDAASAHSVVAVLRSPARRKSGTPRDLSAAANVLLRTSKGHTLGAEEDAAGFIDSPQRNALA